MSVYMNLRTLLFAPTNWKRKVSWRGPTAYGNAFGQVLDTRTVALVRLQLWLAWPINGGFQGGQDLPGFSPNRPIIRHATTNSQGGRKFGCLAAAMLVRLGAWFKKESGTVAGTARGVLRTTVPDPFLNHARVCPEVRDLSTIVLDT